MGLATAVMVLWLNFDSLSKVAEWIGKHPSYLLLTALIYGLLTYLLGALIGRLWISALIVSILGMGLALTDYLKTAINGTPLSLADFGLVTQLGEVAGVAGDLTPPAISSLALQPFSSAWPCFSSCAAPSACPFAAASQAASARWC